MAAVFISFIFLEEGTDKFVGNSNGRRGEGPSEFELDRGAFPYSRPRSASRYVRAKGFF